MNGPPGPVIPIAGLRDVEQIAAGGNLTCARRSDGTVACWGSRYRAYPPQWLASGTDANNWAIDGGAVARDALSGWLRGGSPRHPYFIAHPVTSSSIVGALEIGVASGDLLVRNAAGVFRQEFPFDDVRENDLGYVTSVTARRAQYLGDGVGPLAADPRGPCVAQADGRLRCFPFDAAAMDLPGIDAVAQGVSDGRHACAVTNRGAVFCWGANRDGELGVGAATERPIAAPLRVPSLPPAESVALGESFSCVQLASGEVRCWGLYPHPVGDATTLPASGRLAPQPVVRTPWLVPVDVPGISTATQVVAGRRHACARLRDGRVVCWAASTEASPLLSTPDQMVRAAWLQLFGHLPHEVPLDDVLTLAAGEAHTCALRANHSVVCWGDNSHGQLGDGFVRHADTPASVRFPFW